MGMVMILMDRVFIDSGAFMALQSERDRYHERAAVAYADLLTKRKCLITTNHIVVETCNWLLKERKSGHKAALRFGQLISTCFYPIDLDSLRAGIQPAGGAFLLYSSEAIERDAWSILAKFDTAGFSFTDCVSFAVMESLGIKKAFAFDAHFDEMGFERL